jgi:pre-mRNA-processing factor 39
VAYLPESERVNWRQYLDNEEAEGNETRIRLLYERAIIPTANEEEFWLRYARWNIAHRYYEDARAVLARACLVVSIGRTKIRHYYAALEMSLGHSATARAVYEQILEAIPNSIETLCHLSALISNTDGVHSAIKLVSDQLASGVDRAHVDKLGIIEELERLYLVDNEVDEARNLYHSMSKDFEGFFPFWRKFLQFEMRRPAKIIEDNDSAVHERHVRVKRLHDEIQASTLLPEDKKELAHMYMVFLLADCGSPALEEYINLDRILHKPFFVPPGGKGAS